MKSVSEKIEIALKYFNTGKKEEALKNIEILLNSDQQNEELLMLHAKMSLSLGNITSANFSLFQVLEKNQFNAEALKLIYVNFLKIKKYELAKKYIDVLLNFHKPDYELLRDKAFIEYVNKNYFISEKFIKKALKLNKGEVFGINILGLLYIQKNKTLDAIKYFKRAISIDSKYTDSYNNLGKCYIDLEDLNLAYLCFKKAYKLNPYSSLALSNIANILSLKDKNKLAIHFYQKIKKLEPDNKRIDDNIDICNFRLKNFDWVENKYHEQLKSGNLNYDLVLGYSYLLLRKKKFKEGFELFDARLKTKNTNNQNIYHSNLISRLNFNSNILNNVKTLIVKEGGVGDEILFSSLYGELIKKNLSNIRIECDLRLCEIFKRSFNSNIFFPSGHYSSSMKRCEEFDNIIYAGSLTKFFRQNQKDFNVGPYLKSLELLDIKFKRKLKNFEKVKKIGISWRSVINIYGSLKSLQINDFERLFSKDRLFINLQYGDTTKEIKKLLKDKKNIYSFDGVDLFNDFESLLSILKNLDVLVTVSNSTAHFAGALGVPTILICPKKSSTYYYWDYDDGKTPWYDSVSIVKLEKSIDYTMNLVNDLINKY